jgi:hypothetical protein
VGSLARKLTLSQKLEREVEIFTQAANQRAKHAQIIFDYQDGRTREAIMFIANHFTSLASGQIYVKLSGEKHAVTVPRQAVQQNAFYLACEMLKDFAIMDIRVADFKFDPNLCGECWEPIKRAKKKARKKVKKKHG